MTNRNNRSRTTVYLIGTLCFIGGVAVTTVIFIIVLVIINRVQSTPISEPTKRATSVAIKESNIQPTNTPVRRSTSSPTMSPNAVATLTSLIEATKAPTVVRHEGTRVTAQEFGEDWPLTVPSGYVSAECGSRGGYETNEYRFTTEQGKQYALNGFALQAGLPSIHQITKPQSTENIDRMKMSKT